MNRAVFSSKTGMFIKNVGLIVIEFGLRAHNKGILWFYE
jgi:hypothetical protein